MNITVHYKNGNSWCENIHYMHFKDGFLYMSIQRQVQAVVEIPTKIPIDNIVGYDIYPDTLEKYEIGFFTADGKRLNA